MLDAPVSGGKTGAHAGTMTVMASGSDAAFAKAQPVLDANGEVGLFQRAGMFPIADDQEFPLSPDAARVYKSGPPFLQRYMLFWLATMADRLRLGLRQAVLDVSGRVGSALDLTVALRNLPADLAAVV